MPERRTPPPAQPYLIMNPRSGGGKVGRFELVAKSEELGAHVALLEGPGPVDVAELARAAVADGADLLGVAGGDGTQALVAGIASDHDLPFLVISAGTRNHFALDLGLDRERPDLGLDALRDGVEVRIDLGLIGDRTFVNNASFGAYADVVQSPAYRDDKRGTTLRLLPDILSGHQGPQLVVTVDDVVIEAPKALLVSNNPYELGDVAGLGRRARLDTGELGVVAITIDTAAQAAGLLAGHRARGLRRLTAREVVVDADVPEIPVGIDGEAVLMPTPVRCTIQPMALRVRLPVERPGLLVPKAPIDRAMLRRQAATLRRAAAGRRRSARSVEVAVHRPGRQLGDDRAQHGTDDDVAGVVHAGVHPRVRHDAGQSVQRQCHGRQPVPDPGRERERGRGVPRRERQGGRHRHVAQRRHERPFTVRAWAAPHALDPLVDHSTGDGHGGESLQRRAPPGSPSGHRQHGRRRDPQLGLVGAVRQAPHAHIERRRRRGRDRAVNGLIHPPGVRQPLPDRRSGRRVDGRV